MTDPQLKLELPCPRCGVPIAPAASRCRQCSLELGGPALNDWPTPAPFDLPGAATACGACGALNPAGSDACAGCAEPLGLGLVEEAVVKSSRLRSGARARRRVGPLLTKSGWANLRRLLRLSSVLFLLWSAVDSSVWLTNATASLAPEDPAALRYTMHAIYELVRNAVLVGALWLLTATGTARAE